MISGSGTLAMEMALVSTVTAGEKVLVISQGYFGDRFITYERHEKFGKEVRAGLVEY
ncbi:MAG TPA: hypothetical protein VFJ73_00505 [Bacillales bacterium]|nr:hypothetical protein [Bacillales bacterium]